MGCPQSRSRECREGWLGRRRNYKCRICHQPFQLDLLRPLPVKERICRQCSERKTNG